MRLSAIHRETKETQIQLALDLDGTGKASWTICWSCLRGMEILT